VARVLIIGCGGRGQSLTRELVARGHAVRGTTRDAARADAIAEAGAEPFVGDPDRIGTLMDAIYGVTVVVWLLASASGPAAEELHAGRLRMLCEKLVDTHVRGLVYERSGSLPEEVLAGGEEVVRAASATWNIPVQILSAPCSEFTPAAVAAVEALLA
jgi:uncharacterized protein YbjT (DUF2867 family)